jgi:hypothetical protein
MAGWLQIDALCYLGEWVGYVGCDRARLGCEGRRNRRKLVRQCQKDESRQMMILEDEVFLWLSVTLVAAPWYMF